MPEQSLRDENNIQEEWQAFCAAIEALDAATAKLVLAGRADIAALVAAPMRAVTRWLDEHRDEYIASTRVIQNNPNSSNYLDDGVAE